MTTNWIAFRSWLRRLPFERDRSCRENGPTSTISKAIFPSLWFPSRKTVSPRRHCFPTKLLKQGIRDMVRICDGRMSGTAYGTVVLHVAPEAAAGGPLALVRTGDFVILDVAARRLDIDIPADELAARAPDAATVSAYAKPTRGWERLYVDTVQQANTGADLDFLLGSTGDRVSRESH